MSKESVAIALGFWVIILPFLGFPESWRVAFLVLTGLGLISLGFLMRAKSLSRPPEAGARKTFVESAGHPGSEIR